MMAAPMPVKPERVAEMYEIELRDGSTIELPAAEVDRAGGRYRGFVIQWREATIA